MSKEKEQNTMVEEKEAAGKSAKAESDDSRHEDSFEDTREMKEKAESNGVENQKDEGENSKKFSEEDVTRIVQERLARQRTALEKKIRDEQEKKLREQRLIEEEKWKELAEEKEREAQEANMRLENYEREKTVSALLDKRGITEPVLRKTFQRLRNEDGTALSLEELDAHISDFQKSISAVTESEINKRLESPTPPTKTEAAVSDKKIDQMTIKEKVELIAKVGQEGFQKMVLEQQRAGGQ